MKRRYFIATLFIGPDEHLKQQSLNYVEIYSRNTTVLLNGIQHINCILYSWFRASAGGRQHRGCIIPQAVTHSLVLPKMGKIIARNILRGLEL